MEPQSKPKRPRVRETLKKVFPGHDFDVHNYSFFNKPVPRSSHRRVITVKQDQHPKLFVELTRSPFSGNYYVRRVLPILSKNVSEKEAKQNARNAVDALKKAGYEGFIRKITASQPQSL